MSIEKSALENRNNILEKVLVMRDQELGKFKAEDHVHLSQVYMLPLQTLFAICLAVLIACCYRCCCNAGLTYPHATFHQGGL